MASRLSLQSKLEEILGTKNVYFQPPENLRMEFPCFKYDLSKIKLKKANNAPYLVSKGYSLIYIHRDPDDEMVLDILSLFMYIEHIRQYKSNNLYHDVYQLYF